MPIFRLVKYSISAFSHLNRMLFVYNILHKFYNYLEPVSSTAPKVPTSAKFGGVDGKNGSSLSVLCQVQAHPVPNFRFVEYN